MSYLSLVPQHPSSFPPNEDRRKISIYHQPLMAQEFVLITLRAHKYMYRVFVWWVWIWCGDGWSNMCVLVCQNGLICVCVCRKDHACPINERDVFYSCATITQTKEKRKWLAGAVFLLVCRAYYMLFLFGSVDHFIPSFAPPSHDIFIYSLLWLYEVVQGVGRMDMSLFIWGYLSVMLCRSCGTRTSWLGAVYRVRAKGAQHIWHFWYYHYHKRSY